MSLPPGARVGPYEVTGLLGAGGMGAVLRARDLNLHRDVALKLLPAGFANDPDRRARFAREARLLAALNHPNVAQVYGIEDSPAGPAIAMELVSGQTLRDLLRRGAVSASDALSIAQQVAAGLDAAHERGIVHRDLKPGNVMRTPEGVVKVLDFGLARSQDIASDDAEAVETMEAVTAHGVILGTPAYMSPEQARGHAVDRRTDIWAFGCVLFELFSGRPAFAGATMTDTLAGVIEREPAWDALPSTTPPAVRRLMQRCLEKDPRRRLRDIGDAMPDLTIAGESAAGGRAPEAAATPRRVSVPVVALTAAAGVLAATVGWLLLMPRASGADAPPIRLNLSLPPGTGLGGAVASIEASDLGMSPDGRTLAFIAAPTGAAPRIWMRPLAGDTAIELAGTEGAISMFWSPDGASIGFFAGGQLKRVDVGGGAVVKICDVPSNVGLAGTWGADGVILFASVQGGIMRVEAGGGTPVALIEPDQASPEDRVVWPTFLPDGRRFLYTRLSPGYRGQVMLGDLAGGHVPIVDALSRALWIDPHWLLFVREGTLLAQRIDVDEARVIGEPVSVLGSVAFSAATGSANLAVSPSGVVFAQTHGDRSRLAWFSAAGAELGTVSTPGAYFTLRLSPDDRKLLFTRLRPELGTYDIWMTDFTRSSEARVTSSPGMETGEVWLPGGAAILYAAAAGGPPNLHYRELGSDAERRLQTSPRFHFPNDVTPDGTRVVYQQRTADGGWDLLETSLEPGGPVTPLLSTTAAEYGLRFRADGRMAVLMSAESGRPQAYLTRYPLAGTRVDVSSPHGARAPRWRRDGRGLYFISRSNQLMEVDVAADGTPGKARARFAVTSWLDYDVAADGRFIAVVSEVTGRHQPLTVLVNWR